MMQTLGSLLSSSDRLLSLAVKIIANLCWWFVRNFIIFTTLPARTRLGLISCASGEASSSLSHRQWKFACFQLIMKFVWDFSLSLRRAVMRVNPMANRSRAAQLQSFEEEALSRSIQSNCSQYSNITNAAAFSLRLMTFEIVMQTVVAEADDKCSI